MYKYLLVFIYISYYMIALFTIFFNVFLKHIDKFF